MNPAHWGETSAQLQAYQAATVALHDMFQVSAKCDARPNVFPHRLPRWTKAGVVSLRNQSLALVSGRQRQNFYAHSSSQAIAGSLHVQMSVILALYLEGCLILVIRSSVSPASVAYDSLKTVVTGLINMTDGLPWPWKAIPQTITVHAQANGQSSANGHKNIPVPDLFPFRPKFTCRYLNVFRSFTKSLREVEHNLRWWCVRGCGWRPGKHTHHLLCGIRTLINRI